MSAHLLYSMYCLLDGTFPDKDQHQDLIPHWMHLSSPLKTHKKKLWRDMNEESTIKPSLCGHSCTELISTTDFEDSSCCSLFLIFGGRFHQFRDGSCHVCDENSLYLFEMVDFQFSTSLIYVDPVSDSETQVVKPRFCHSSVFDKDRMLMYIYGGKSADECFNDLAIFDIRTSLWTSIDFEKVGCSVIPQERYGHCSVLHKNWMLICGGMDRSGNIIDGIQALDLERCIWMNIQVENSLSGRSYFTMDVIERRENEIEIIIAGGKKARESSSTAPLERVIVSGSERSLTYSIIPIDSPNWDKYGHCSVYKNQTLLLVGGTNQNDTLDGASLEYCNREFSLFSYGQQPSDHCGLPFLNISQEISSVESSENCFTFAALLYDSTLNCYIVGGSRGLKTKLDYNPAFKELYEDGLANVISFLDHDDLKSCSLVSKKFYRASCSDMIWKPILKRFLDNSEGTLKDHNYKEQFQAFIIKKKSKTPHWEELPIFNIVGWFLKREPFKRKDLILSKLSKVCSPIPNITSPCKTINISILGDASLVSKFIKKLIPDGKYQSKNLSTLQFYHENVIYHLILNSSENQLDQSNLVILCLNLQNKHDLQCVNRKLNGVENLPPTVVLGIGEESQRTLIFKRRSPYSNEFQYYLPYSISRKDLLKECEQVKSIVACEEISIVNGYGMDRLLEFLLTCCSKQ